MLLHESKGVRHGGRGLDGNEGGLVADVGELHKLELIESRHGAVCVGGREYEVGVEGELAR